MGPCIFGIPLFGVPFIAVGLGMMATPFWPLYTAKRTIFAVTDQRLIQIRIGRSLKSETVPAERIGKLTRTERSDGSGTLKIATKVGRDSDSDETIKTFDIGEVAQVLQVERVIDDLAKQHRARGGRARA